MTLQTDLNAKLTEIKDNIETLYGRAKDQAISFYEKDKASYNELSNIQKRDEDLQESFIDGSKILETNDLVYDKEGWTNAFEIEEIMFPDEYYTKITHPMAMNGGIVIPGSYFSDIFGDRDGFWGYMTQDKSEVNCEFTVSLKLKTNETTVNGNRIYIHTNKETTITAYYRSSLNSDWISLGEREGTHHTWCFPWSGVELRFTTKTSIFAITNLSVGNALFDQSGHLISTWYEVDDLRKLDVNIDADIPQGCAIRKFINITDTPPSIAPQSGWVSWENEDIITLAAEEIKAPVVSGYIIPSGYIDNSIVLRDGYMNWEEINTTDYALVTERLEVLGTNYLDITAGYQVISDGVKNVHIGNGEDRTVFSKDDDYTVDYDTINNNIKIGMIPTGRLNNISETKYSEVSIRKPVSVVQRRTFVYLNQDDTIDVSIPTAGIDIRTLHIGDTIENEITTQDVSTGTHSFAGKLGLNLVEVEGFDANNPPVITSPHIYFGSRYWETETSTFPPPINKYYLNAENNGIKLSSGGSNLFLRYLYPSEYNNVAVKLELVSNGRQAPLLRGYKLINTIDKV